MVLGEKACEGVDDADAPRLFDCDAECVPDWLKDSDGVIEEDDDGVTVTEEDEDAEEVPVTDDDCVCVFDDN